MQKNQVPLQKEQEQAQQRWKHLAVWEKLQEVKLQDQKTVVKTAVNSFQKN